MRVITAADIDRVMEFPALVAALGEAFRTGIETPERHHHHIERPDAAATLLLMPAWTAAGRRPAFVGTKVVSIFPGNGARGMPSVQGSYILLDGDSGVPVAVLDGTRLTVWRTAAASALAASLMARADARHLVMVGAGALAPFLVRAHRAVRPIERVTLWNRRRAGAEAVAAGLAADGIACEVTEDLEAAVRKADIVSCATLSRVPLVRGDWLAPGAHLDLVGAFNLEMREADDAALLRARVVVDTEAALTEGGDVAVAIRDGGYSRDAVLGTLFDLAAGRLAPRSEPGEVTLFKSVGTAIEDLAAAMHVWSRLSEG